jgi:predicted RNase H-like nuclease
VFDALKLTGRLEEVLGAFPDAAAYGVDMPIGLPSRATRPADEAARSFVGPRWQSVFFAPPRPVLGLPYEEAVRRCARLGAPGVSKQAFALSRKILEVDALAPTEPRMVEVHPEVSFRELAAAPLPSKHTWTGFARRRSALARAGIDLPDDLPGAPLLDVLDAAAAAWSAARYARGEALPLPEGATERIGAIWR